MNDVRVKDQLVMSVEMVSTFYNAYGVWLFGLVHAHGHYGVYGDSSRPWSIQHGREVSLRMTK